MPDVSSLNVFTQSTSQFQVLDSVPEIIQRADTDTDQHDTSHIASALAIRIMDQTTDIANTDQCANHIAGAAAIVLSPQRNLEIMCEGLSPINKYQPRLLWICMKSR